MKSNTNKNKNIKIKTKKNQHQHKIHSEDKNSVENYYNCEKEYDLNISNYKNEKNEEFINKKEEKQRNLQSESNSKQFIERNSGIIKTNNSKISKYNKDFIFNSKNKCENINLCEPKINKTLKKSKKIKRYNDTDAKYNLFNIQRNKKIVTQTIKLNKTYSYTFKLSEAKGELKGIVYNIPVITLSTKIKSKLKEFTIPLSIAPNLKSALEVTILNNKKYFTNPTMNNLYSL